SFSSSRFSFLDCFKDSFEVLFKLFVIERCFSDWSVDDSRFVRTVLNFTCFDFRNSFRDIESHCACFRVRHQAFRSQYATDFTNFAHHVRSCNDNVEIEPALLDFSDVLCIACIVCTSSFRFFQFFAFSENENALSFTSTVWKHDCPTDLLVVFTSVDSKTECDFNSCVKVDCACFLCKLDRFFKIVCLCAIDKLCRLSEFFTSFSH